MDYSEENQNVSPQNKLLWHILSWVFKEPATRISPQNLSLGRRFASGENLHQRSQVFSDTFPCPDVGKMKSLAFLKAQKKFAIYFLWELWSGRFHLYNRTIFVLQASSSPSLITFIRTQPQFFLPQDGIQASKPHWGVRVITVVLPRMYVNKFLWLFSSELAFCQVIFQWLLLVWKGKLFLGSYTRKEISNPQDTKICE